MIGSKYEAKYRNQRKRFGKRSGKQIGISSQLHDNPSLTIETPILLFIAAMTVRFIVLLPFSDQPHLPTLGLDI